MILPTVVIDSAILVTPRLSALPVELIPIHGTSLQASDLKNAQALLTRTVTRVDSDLLKHSSLTFVGTASAGTDHIDGRYLTQRNIALASAGGCNAAAVADYVIDAIYLSGRLEPLMSGASVGLVGYGAVGRHLAGRLSALGAHVKVHDPFVPTIGREAHACGLAEVLACSVVSLHAALHNSQPHPSFQMIDSLASACVAPEALFINAGRGGLVTEEALHRMADKGVTLVLDTWPNEPDVSMGLLSQVSFATPHIAGYTRTAKVNATDFLIEPLMKALNLESAMSATSETEETKISIDFTGESDVSALMKTLATVSQLSKDDDTFRRNWDRSPTSDNFEAQRRDYRLRRQYSDVSITARNVSTKTKALLKAAGFGSVN